MVKIFAKHGTSDKALVICAREEVLYAQKRLSEKFGGNWLLVDKIDRNNAEFLLFNDNFIYKGFHGKDERYCNGIETFQH
ncbi:hypothetical protein M2138_001709 [Dysgonomonadaceae bacterium PH5-43]|nr:hypothetical protein [Dysgonomonadaceae bacterium PH5-43]